MKKYKVVQVHSAGAFETSLNELAQAGWKVIASNMATLPEAADDDFVYFALLESAPIEEELKQMIEENTDELDALDSLDNVDLSPSAN
ncbi:hypothetical protein GCM10027443_39710 [Pontibacter brevis]